MKKSVNLFVTSFVIAKNREYLALLTYKDNKRIFMDSREYSSDQAVQLLGTITALRSLHAPVRVLLYLNSHKLQKILDEYLAGYCALGTIQEQSQSQLLIEYRTLSKKHEIEVVRSR